MNPTLLSHPGFSLDYPLPTESEYLSGDRPYSTSTQFSSSDFFPTHRKNGLLSHSGSLAVPINTAFRHHPIHDAPSHSSSSALLLSPPDSLSGSLTAATTAPSTSNLYSSSNLPRYFSSNASVAEPFPNAPAHSLPMLFEPSIMSEHNPRARVPALYPPSSSPAVTYSANGLGPYPPPSYLPNPFQNQPFQRPNQHTGVPDVNGARYTAQPPFLQPPLSTWSPRDAWGHPTMANDTRTGRQNSPPFEDTKIVREVVNYRGQHVSPEIQASIPKGFFEVEGKWTCYRRNYFPVLCSFTTKPSSSDGTYYLQGSGQHLTQIMQFAVSISAKTASVNNQESQSRGLVQHTPKRDKATESTPGKVIIQPATQMSPESRHPTMHAYSSAHTVSPNMISHYEPFSGGQQQSPPTQHTFERIQFQKATANNGKRRAQQQFFHVVVELWANIGHGKSDWQQIATRQSAQMVVRGRSPGHYKDNGRRDSTTSMDPDRGSGSGGDSIFHTNGASFGSHPHSNNGMEWTQNGSGGDHHYSGGTYRRYADMCSPQSDNSSGTFAGSHTKIEFGFKGTPRIDSPLDSECKASEDQYEGNAEFDLASFPQSTGRKRSYEEEHTVLPSVTEHRRSYHVDAFLPSHFDYSPSQPLSVS